MTNRNSIDTDVTVVGLGASAGGIQAVEQFLERMPADTGMAFVVILHLSPDHESRLAEILRKFSTMSVTQVTQSVEVESNHVYVVPPNHSLSMVDGRLTLSEVTRVEERRAPIDVFFRTLGETHRSRAVGVVLSGTGADGSMGLKRIKEHGGLCFAQDPEDAEHGEMPRSAIATGIIDAVLPAREIPQRLLALTEQLTRLDLVGEAGQPELDEQALGDIFSTIRTHTGHDFTNYKRPTVMRRIARRMAVNDVTTLSGYAGRVRERPQEQEALVKDLLISVTHFFRDRDAFATLESRVVPQLFQGKGEEDQVRIWVAGCATGEEAYSIGILLAEHAARLPAPPAIQIFATDLDAASITLARQGLYTLNDAADVSPERLRQFFMKDGQGYRVRPELRESVLFSQHDVIKDPPFSHLDLVSCRNLLIYLNRAAQRRVMEVIHFSLKPNRLLFLGSSESVEVSADLFVPVDQDAYLFESRAVPARLGLPVPRSGGRPAPQDLPIVGGAAPAAQRRRLSADLHLHLLEQYAPPSVVVSGDHEILHLSASVGRYLELAAGDASLNVLRVVRPELRLELRSALRLAARQRTPVETTRLSVRLSDTVAPVSLLVKPLVQSDGGTPDALLVLFREESDQPPPGLRGVPVRSDDAAPLDPEVTRLKGELRAVLEDQDVQREEHKAALEEQQAMYEELRSSSEELETSREELQSLNEELRTVNQELRIKIDEQIQASDDMQNLVGATEIGTIFLDRSLRIKLFTPSIRTIFSLIPGDRGRPLSDINSSLVGGGEQIHRDAERVLATLGRAERELPMHDGRWMMMRAHPYRTSDDRIDGVVLTFVDITERKRASDLVQESETRLRQATDVENVGIIFFALDGRLLHANEAFLRMTGFARHELDAGLLRRDMLTPAEWRESVDEKLAELRRTGRTAPYQREYVRRNGTRCWVVSAATLLGAEEGVEFIVDNTKAKQIEASLKSSEARLRLMIESVTEYAIITMDAEGRIDHWNTGAARLFGYTEAEILGRSASLLFTSDDRAAGDDREELRQARQTGHASDERWHLRKDGVRFFCSGVTAPILDDQGAVKGYVKVARDLTDRENAEHALQEVNDALEERVRQRTAELADANHSLEAELLERRRAEQSVRGLLGRIMAVQEDERRRISRDIHDHVGQQIVALKLKLETLEQAPFSDIAAIDAAREGIAGAKAMIATLDRDIDYVTWQLRPPLLEELGLPAALRKFVEDWSETFGIPAEFHTARLDGQRLSTSIETSLYRIAQEALNNIHKHAGATVVGVILERRGDALVLTIDDDGRGFDPAHDDPASRSIGLLGMRERASLAGGSLEIESALGRGTTIFVNIPLTPPPPADLG